MMCTNHPDRNSIGTCAQCAKPICAECAVTLADSQWCRECLKGIVAGVRKHHHRLPWRKIIAGMLSAVPGAGHMFLGAIGKGFALMGIFFLSVFLIILYGDSTGMYWIIAYLLPTLGVLFLCYALFDTFAIADAEKAKRENHPAPGEDPLKTIWERVLMSRRTIGWVLLLAGIVGMLNIFSGPLNLFAKTYLQVEIPFAGLVLPTALLVIGVLLVGKGGKRR